MDVSFAMRLILVLQRFGYVLWLVSAKVFGLEGGVGKKRKHVDDHEKLVGETDPPALKNAFNVKDINVQRWLLTLSKDKLEEMITMLKLRGVGDESKFRKMLMYHDAYKNAAEMEARLSTAKTHLYEVFEKAVLEQCDDGMSKVTAMANKALNYHELKGEAHDPEDDLSSRMGTASLSSQS